MKTNKYWEIGIITTFGRNPGDIFLINLIKVVSSFSSILHIIGPVGNIKNKKNVIVHYVSIRATSNIILRILTEIFFQIKVSLKVLKHSSEIHRWVIFGGEWLLLPILTIKIIGGSSTIVLAGSSENESKFGNRYLYFPLLLMKRLNCFIVNKIIIYSIRMVDICRLAKHKHKIQIAHEHFVDFDSFKVYRMLKDRSIIIGFVGRFSPEKGILNLVQAIPIINANFNNYDFKLIGDGSLTPQVKEMIEKDNIQTRITLLGWIPHKNLPYHLNDLKLIVIPSFTEGLPNVMLEAMACGTPVLATPVGAIPDYIKDGETGFLMENNSPECIAKNVIRALNHPDLEKIAYNGRMLVTKEFTFEKTVEIYSNILSRKARV